MPIAEVISIIMVDAIILIQNMKKLLNVLLMAIFIIFMNRHIN